MGLYKWFLAILALSPQVSQGDRDCKCADYSPENNRNLFPFVYASVPAMRAAMPECYPEENEGVDNDLIYYTTKKGAQDVCPPVNKLQFNQLSGKKYGTVSAKFRGSLFKELVLCKDDMPARPLFLDAKKNIIKAKFSLRGDGTKRYAENRSGTTTCYYQYFRQKNNDEPQEIALWNSGDQPASIDNNPQGYKPGL
jgi:hypothetical protein